MAKTEETEETPMRSQMWKHEDFVEWATEEEYLDPKADQATTIAVFAAKRNEYRRTERYRDLVEEHRESAAEAKQAAAAERKAKKEAEKAKEKPAAAKKAPAKKTAAKKTTSKRRGAAASEENPFDED